MIKNTIKEIIEMTETILGIKGGSITWSIVGRQFKGSSYVCVQFSINSFEFINIMSPIENEYKNDEEMINDILSAEDEICDRVISVLSTYGLINLVRNVSEKQMKFMYIVNLEAPDPESVIRFDNLCLN